MKAFIADIKNSLTNQRFWLVLLLLIAGGLVIAQPAAADLGETVVDILGWIIQGIVNFLGQLITIVINVVVAIAQYNSFTTNDIVSDGWIIVRDLCNMFFILIMLIVAVSMILRLQGYTAGQLLKKVIVFAVLINFSKLICGLLIDFAQIIMLTFVSGFKGIGRAGFTNIMGIDKLLNISTLGTTNVDLWTVLASYLLALVFSFIALAVMAALLGILVMRIIMLWVYVILSPFAYLLNILPVTSRYASMWWSNFSKELIVGPVLAFFMWLSLITVGNPKYYDNPQAFLTDQGFASVAHPEELSSDFGATVENWGIGAATGGTMPFIMRFIVGVALLIGGMVVTQQIGSAAGKVGGNIYNKFNAGAKWMKGKAVGGVKAGARVGKRAAVGLTRRAGYGLADVGLGAAGKIPLVGPAAMRKQAQLRMKRRFEEEKDLKYMQFYNDKDLDRIIAKGKGVVLESTRKDYERALREKARRKGADFGIGGTAVEKKTDQSLKMLESAGHSLTRSGLDAFSNEDLGEKAMEFMKRNIGQMDENIIRNYYTELNQRGEARYGAGPANFSPSSLGDVSNPAMYGGHTVEGIIPHTANRLSKKDLLDIHHTQLSDTLLNVLLLDAAGNIRPNKKVAGLYDDGTVRQRRRLDDWAASHGGAATVFGNRGPGPSDYGSIGRSFKLNNKTNSIMAATGISGLNRPEKGRFGVDFSNFSPLMPEDKKFDPQDAGLHLTKDSPLKAMFASLVSGRLKAQGIMADSEIEKIVNSIKSLDHVILHNKAIDAPLSTRKGVHAHELLHARFDDNFSRDEQRVIWNGLPTETKDEARQKIGKIWGSDYVNNEDALMAEYFAESVRSKTRWNQDVAINLHPQAEQAIDQALRAKGSSLDHLISNLTEDRVGGDVPAADNGRKEVEDNLAGAISPELQGSMNNLIKSLENIGGGIDALTNVAGSIDSFKTAVGENSRQLMNQSSLFRSNSEELSGLLRAVKNRQQSV